MRLPCKMQNTTMRKAILTGCLSTACLMLASCQSSNDDGTTSPEDRPGELNAAQRATLPDDCLLALDETKVAYCFSPQDRNLMAVLIDGSTFWRYPLPGDNISNHVEAVVIAGDTLVLVADTGPNVGDSSYEISRFETDGAFIETLPILEPFKRLRGDDAANSPAWDLDEQGLLVVADSDALYIGSSVHALIDGGERASLTNWRLDGASITRIDALSGERTAWRVLPEQLVDGLALVSEDRIAVEVGDLEEHYHRSDLSADARDPDSQPLDPSQFPVVLPYAFKQLQGDRLNTFRDDVETLLAIAVPDPVALEEPDCVLENPEFPGSNCSGEVQQGPFSWNCPVSGSVTLNQQATVSFVSGTGRSTSEAYQYEFIDCELDVVADESLADGRYRFSGTFETSLANPSIRQGGQELRRFAFIGAELLYPDGAISVDGEQRDDSTFTSFALNEKDITLNRFESTRPSDAFVIENLSFHSEYENIDKQRVSMHGGLRLSSPVTAKRTLRMQIDPPLANLYFETDPVTLSGIVRLETDSGDGLTITALENLAFPGDEQLQILLDVQAEPSITRPFECLMIPCY